MPVINDKYYMNPQYGKAVERDLLFREADRRAHGEQQPSWLDYHLGFAEKPPRGQAYMAQVTSDDKKGDGIPRKAEPADRTDRGATSYAEKNEWDSGGA